MSESTRSLVRKAALSVLLWLLVPAGAQLGIFVHDAMNPSAVAQADAPPPSTLFGVVGLVLGVVAAIVVSLWLRLGVIWFGVALLVAAFLGALAMALSPTVVVVLILLVPPLAGAWTQWRLDQRDT